MRKLKFVWLAVALVFAGLGCSKKDEGSKDKGKSATKGAGNEYTYDCKIFIRQKAPPPIKGKVKMGLEDEAAAKAEALKAACDQLPEAERAACPDKKKYRVQWVSASASSGGKTFHSPNVTLQAKVAEHKGKASGADKDKACKDATTAACKAAGAGGDCVSSGKWEQSGISTTKQLKM